MATLSQSLRLHDGFSPILKNINQAMNLTLNGFEKMQRATGNNMNVKEFELARNMINDVGAEIREAEERQQNFNNRINQGTRNASNLLNNVKSLVTTYAIFETGKKFLFGSDSYAGYQARLGLINDGLQTTQELNDKIFESAQRARGGYYQTLDVVGKLGITAKDAFANNDEIIYFSELMTKNFKIAGASATEQAAAMYQLTQAMASGRLQGDEFRSIIENAPLLAKAIAEEMDVSMGKLKEMSSEGIITSEVIKAALFNSADEINTAFEQLPVRFSDITTSIISNLQMRLQPSFARFSDWLNSDVGQQFFNNLGAGIIRVTLIASRFFDIITWIANVFTQHWPQISGVLFMILMPLLLLKGTLMAYNMILGITNGMQLIAATRAVASGSATLAEAAAKTTATESQLAFNAALYSCPLTLIIIAIIAVIGILRLFGVTTGDVIGFVVGVFFSLFTVVQNIFAVWYNSFGAFSNFFRNVFIDPVGAVKMLFLDLATNIISYILSIVGSLEKLINLIPGVELNMSQGLSNMLDMIEKAKKTLEDETGVKSFKPMEFKSITEAYGKGFDVGSGAWDKIASKFSFDTDMDNLFPENTLPDNLNIDNIDRVNSIGGIDDSVDVSSEDLKTMRELAEMKSIQNFVSLTPTVEVQTGDINNGTDVDTIVGQIKDTLEVEIAANVKGAYGLG